MTKTNKLMLSVSTILISGAFLSACGSDDDNSSNVSSSPVIPVEQTPKNISLSKIGSYTTGQFGVSAAEIPAFDPASKRGFVVNAQAGALDILDLSNPASPRYLGQIKTTDLVAGAQVNSVAVHDGILAVAVQAASKTDTGFVAFYRAKDAAFISRVNVGALPDMLTFSSDGKTVLVANEAEPAADYQIDPEGSVSIINVSDINKPTARTANFQAWNGKESELRAQGIRIFGANNPTAAQDLEPEYISLSADNQTAWVSLQENNAIGKIDIASAKVTAIYPLGFKDHGQNGQGLDASDADGASGAGQINIKTWSGLRGLYLPDAISSYQADGKTYLVTANEGDARAWFSDEKAYFSGDLSKGFVEEWRVKHLVNKDGFNRRLGEDLPAHLRAIAKGAELNPQVFAYCGAIAGNPGKCRDDDQLGRLNITWTQGYQTNADGTPRLNERGNLVYDALYSFGGRSFTIWTENASKTGLERVWDSGDQFEQHIAQQYPAIFNANHEEAGMDNRSDNKGPEPEGIALGKIGEKTFAFVGLERVGGVMVYDISKPNTPVFVQYINSRQFSATTEQIKAGQGGDLGPEGLAFISAKTSPTGKPLLMVGHEVSGSTAMYELALQY